MSVRAVCAGAALSACLWASGALAAENPFPFFGAWVRADRACSATSTRERIYTPHDVVSSRGRCTIRKVVAGSASTYELFERCDRPNERSAQVRETIRMIGQDGMVLTRRTARLKLSRSIRYTRCAAPVTVPAR